MSRIAAVVATLVALVFVATVWRVVRAPVEPSGSPLVVDDVSQLNPIRVSEVITPTKTEEIVEAVRRHSGPIAIGGARHSMGGQIATAGALHIDTRQFNGILNFSPAAKSITVLAGTRWREIQERIDRANLSVKIMQTYATFTVGGSLSVNGHGRYVGLGPLIHSVKSLKVVLADGSLVEASPSQNSDIFYGVIGGYGGLGVIAEATLELTDNVKVRRHDETMPITEYKRYFGSRIRGSPTIFHNADIYPSDYTTVHAVSYAVTDDPVTVGDRLSPTGESYRLDRFLFWAVSEWPFGHTIRRRLIDPVYFAGEPVTWRNYEASYDAAELEPASRATSTYVLEEYFVPVDRFDDFVRLMRDVYRRHRVNVINVSIRHASQDPGSLLAWARTEVFAFVVYYKQETNDAAKKEVGAWTRELIDAALRVGGSYYLPYQLHATNEQFYRAYPRAPEFFALKRRLDPTNKFRNELLDKYSHPPQQALGIDRVAWLQGCWEAASPQRTVEEQWMTPRGKTMVGVSRTVRGGALTEYELVVLREEGDRLTYEAHPSGQPAAVFVARSASDSVVVFENPTHDFPQRVGYQRNGDDALLAWIEGPQNGQTRRVEFPYRRVRCPRS